MRNLLIFLLLSVPFLVNAQSERAIFRIWLKDKKGAEYNIEKPRDFLSQKAIERRLIQNIPVKTNDLPVSENYLDSLRLAGAKILFTSKWFNTALCHIEDSATLEGIRNFTFVKRVEPATVMALVPLSETAFQGSGTPPYPIKYGTSLRQVNMLNGHLLHREGFQGNGKIIAVTDAGFFPANYIDGLKHLFTDGRILLTRDLIRGGKINYGHSTHGFQVLSIMAGYIEGVYLGTAPAASYILLVSEDVTGENPYEEDAWVAAAELADSAGADIINVSLGYSDFDSTVFDFTYSMMTGDKTIISRGVDIAASKGMLVVTSAGNQGLDKWKYITAPADADSSLSVGAVDSFGHYAFFSSQGPAADGSHKPEVVAMGQGTAVLSPKKEIDVEFGNGTSFSGPLISGMAACLWQIYPAATNMEIKDAIVRSASLYPDFNVLTGYGIPDFYRAAILLGEKYSGNLKNGHFITAYPNPFERTITVNYYSAEENKGNIAIVSPMGEIIYRVDMWFGAGETHKWEFNLPGLRPGLYLIMVQTGDRVISHRIMSR